MKDMHKMPQEETAIAAAETPAGRFQKWLEDPMGQVVIASVATMSTLGIVLSSIWAIDIVLG